MPRGIRYSLIYRHRSPAAVPERAVKREGCRRNRDTETQQSSEDGDGGATTKGRQRENTVHFPHTLHCARLSSQYIRLNCIHAEECSRMIYVRGFNTVAHTARYCRTVTGFRVSPSANDDHTATRKTIRHTFFRLSFFLSSLEPGAVLNSHVAAEKVSAAAGVTPRPDIFSPNEELPLNSVQNCSNST